MDGVFVDGQTKDLKSWVCKALLCIDAVNHNDIISEA